jgi:hypothetical protein
MLNVFLGAWNSDHGGLTGMRAETYMTENGLLNELSWALGQDVLVRLTVAADGVVTVENVPRELVARAEAILNDFSGASDPPSDPETPRDVLALLGSGVTLHRAPTGVWAGSRAENAADALGLIAVMGLGPGTVVVLEHQGYDATNEHTDAGVHAWVPSAEFLESMRWDGLLEASREGWVWRRLDAYRSAMTFDGVLVLGVRCPFSDGGGLTGLIVALDDGGTRDMYWLKRPNEGPSLLALNDTDQTVHDWMERKLPDRPQRWSHAYLAERLERIA